MDDKLTPHAKKILSALTLTPTKERNIDGWWLRYDIGCKVYGTARGIQLRQMKCLQERGLVEPEHQVAVELVDIGLCSCGCDRWRLTEAGRQLTSTWAIADHSKYRMDKSW